MDKSSALSILGSYKYLFIIIQIRNIIISPLTV